MKFISVSYRSNRADGRQRERRAVAVGLAEHAWVCACVGTCGSSCAAHTHGAPAFSLIHGLRAAGCGEVCVPQLVVRLSRGVVWVRLS